MGDSGCVCYTNEFNFFFYFICYAVPGFLVKVFVNYLELQREMK